MDITVQALRDLFTVHPESLDPFMSLKLRQHLTRLWYARLGVAPVASDICVLKPFVISIFQ